MSKVYVVFDGDDLIFCAGWPEACHEHINDAINEFRIKGAEKWRVIEMAAASNPAPVTVPNEDEERKAFDKWHTRYGKGFVVYSEFNGVELTAAWKAWLARAMLAAAPAAPSADAQDAWQPIETAPEVKGDFFFCRLAWGRTRTNAWAMAFAGKGAGSLPASSMQSEKNVVLSSASMR